MALPPTADQRNSNASAILPVLRSRKEAKQLYDSISIFYDYLTMAFERKYAEKALDRLSIAKGEAVLEIGFGTGHCLKRIAEAIGQTGKAYGVDISSGMLEVTKRRLERAGLMDKAELCCGDAMNLPYRDSAFNAVFMSFTLELFDTPEIPIVLSQIKRVLKPEGRFGVASISREDGGSMLLRLYEWIHKKWPKYVDCRPIYVEQSLRNAEYDIRVKEKVRLFGLPGEIVVAVKGRRQRGPPEEGA
ncbi:MAG: class I SAM-dependent methyltransferase [Thermoplasmata archaeon]